MSDENFWDLLGPLIEDDEPPEFQRISTSFRKYMECRWPGEVTLLTNSAGVDAMIYTDRRECGGSISLIGAPDGGDFGAALALYWQEMHDKGYSAAEVFDSLRAEFGVRDIWEVDDLTGLAEYSLTARRDDDDDEDE